MKIIIDAMGGDNAPEAITRGALLAVEEFGVEVCLVGKGEEILTVIRDEGHDDLPEGVEISHASEVIDMEDDPTAVMRQKKDSSIAVACRLLAEGYGDALVSAGNTGALLTGATLTAKRIKGIRRGAVAPTLPTARGPALLIDGGANAECAPEYLLQFAFMGAFYTEKVLGKTNPRVGLLNIGTEPTKGTETLKEAWKLLDAAGKEGRINFVGNVEAREVITGSCDVIVADGYGGNILLKSIEGTGMYFYDMLRKIFTESTRSKFAAILVQDGLRGMKKMIDYNETGGAPLLGISKPVIKAHGSAQSYTFRSAIKQAIDYVNSDIIGDIVANIDHMRATDTEQLGPAE